MIAKTELAPDGVARPLFDEAPIRAVGADGLPGALFTRHDFTCAAFSPRQGSIPPVFAPQV